MSALFGPDSIFIALGAALLAVMAAFFKGRLDGAKLERAKQSEAEAKARTVADEVQNDVGAMPPDARREELRRWSK